METKINLPEKRKFTGGILPPSKRGPKLTPLVLTEDLQRAKTEFARALDARMANSNSRLDFESNPFVVADKPVTDQIKSREKNYKNSRDFVLQASEKKFTQALTILQDLEKAKKKKEEEEKEKALAKKPENSNLDGFFSIFFADFWNFY